MTLPVPFRVHVLKPNFVSNAHKIPERSDVDSGLSQKHLQFASGLFVGLVSSLKQSIHNVCHRFLHGNDDTVAHREALSPLTLSEQIREAGWMLLTLLVSFPIFFELAHALKG